jgi:hypothetical protein
MKMLPWQRVAQHLDWQFPQRALYALLFSLVFSAPMWLVNSGIGQTTSPLSLDYACLFALFVFFGLKARNLLFIVILIMLDIIGYGPNGVTLPDIAQEGRLSISTISTSLQLTLFVVPLVSVIGLTALGNKVKIISKPQLALFVFLIAAIAIAGRYLPSGKIFRSGTIQSAKILFVEPKLFNIRAGVTVSSAEKIDDFSLLPRFVDPGKDTLLIMVESLGVPVKESQTFLDSFATVIGEGRSCTTAIQRGTRNSDNFTIQAEFRELCSLKVNGFRPSPLPTECFPRLTPNSTAYHNNSASFYGRNHVYENVGFKKFWSKDNLILSPSPFSPFGGIPDSEMASFIIENSRKNRGFHYWMTLDLHSPYTAGRFEHGTSLPPADIYLQLRELQGKLFNRMVREMPSYNVLIIGDHPPKFFSANDKNYAPATVPYFFIPACSPNKP